MLLLLTTVALGGLTTGGARAQAMELGPEIQGTATNYGASYHGSRMGCGGTYSTDDPTIVAVSLGRAQEWPCGQELLITGPAGSIVATRQDSCPGCPTNMVDLSERGNSIVCGGAPHTCSVTIQEIR